MELKEKVEEVKTYILDHVIDNHNDGYEAKDRALKEISDFCLGKHLK